jgi:hypothetical protein
LDDQSLEWKYAQELPEDFRIEPFHSFESGQSKRRRARLPGEGRTM